jgi:hypothetical protein
MEAEKPRYDKDSQRVLDMFPPDFDWPSDSLVRPCLDQAVEHRVAVGVEPERPYIVALPDWATVGELSANIETLPKKARLRGITFVQGANFGEASRGRLADRRGTKT